MTEVATRALTAVRFQKYNVHRWLRPEALAGRIDRVNILGSSAPGLLTIRDQLDNVGILAIIRHKTPEARSRVLRNYYP